MSTDLTQPTSSDLFGGLIGSPSPEPIPKPELPKPKPKAKVVAVTVVEGNDKDKRIAKLSDTIKKVNALNIFIASRLKKEKDKTAKLKEELRLLRDQFNSMTEEVDDVSGVDISMSLEDIEEQF